MSQAATAKSGSSVAHTIRRAVAFFCREAIGLAQDFWKDGDGTFTQEPRPKRAKTRAAASEKGAQESAQLWHAAPGEISERMWGEGAVTPGDARIDALLIKPLNLVKGTSVLDLSAGLGARMKGIASQYGASVTGLEPDPDVAARGQDLLRKKKIKGVSLNAYDPSSFSEKNQYECIIFRETVYRVADREKFVAAIAACSKPGVRISFTDYIVNPESKERPEILAWRAYEESADPIGLVQMAEIWAKAGIVLKSHEDETEQYIKEVKAGFQHFMEYITSGHVPDEETKKAIEKRIRLWSHRLAALDQGMRYYRFFGQKQYADPFAGGAS